MTHQAPQVTADDIVLASDFVNENPHMFPAGPASLKTISRKRKYNGLSESGGMFLRFNHLFINRPKFVEWFAAQAH